MKNLKHQLINHLADRARFEVEYYSNLFDPDHSNNHGFSVSEGLERSRDKLMRVQSDIKDFKYWLDNDHDPFKYILEHYRIDFIESLKTIIRDSLRMAQNWEDNYLIRWRCYREVVTCKQWLDKIDSRYQQFAPRYFLYYN